MINLKQFLTIEKEVYNHYLERMSKKVFRFYNGKYLPPTIGYTPNPRNCKNLLSIPKTLGLKIKTPTEEEKIKFKENIEIQENILNQIKNRNENFNYRCGLIYLKTGKGKSHVIVDITNYYQTNTLILVHNVKTLGEMCKKFKDFTNIEPKVYGGGKKELGKITIMTKKSFTLDYEKIENNFNLVLVDEAPVQFSPKFTKAMNIFFNNREGVAFYGLSGTPFKDLLSSEDLEKYFGKLIIVKGQKNNGYNVLPDFKLFDYYYKGRYEYENPAEMRTAISENPERLKEQIKTINENIFTSDRKCLLILTDRKEEINNFLQNKSENFGYTFEITGDTKIEDDEKNVIKAKKLIESGKRVTIIGTIQKVGIGVDIPFIDTIFLASAIKFKGAVIQAIGRALRIYKDKNKPLIGVWNDLPILKNQKSEKLKTIKEEYLIPRRNIPIIQIGTKPRIKF